MPMAVLMDMSLLVLMAVMVRVWVIEVTVYPTLSCSRKRVLLSPSTILLFWELVTEAARKLVASNGTPKVVVITKEFVSAHIVLGM